MDVLSASSLDDVVVWYENDGSESFTDHIIDSEADGAWSLDVGDIDRDGNIDVLSASRYDDSVRWYENDGSEEFTEHVIDSSSDGARSVVISDLDSDGDIDVLVASENDDTVAWFENDGSEDFTAHEITTSADGVWSAHVGDMDLDGDLDVVIAAVNGTGSSWFENDGSESFTEHIIPISGGGGGGGDNGASLNTSIPVDIDGDGDLDVVGASGLDDEISWFENHGGSVNYTISDVAPASLVNGEKDVVLSIEVEHNGIPLDNDIELTEWTIFLEETDGDVLTSIEANDLIENLIVYADDGDGDWDTNDDTVVVTIGSIALFDGFMHILFTDGDTDIQIAPMPASGGGGGGGGGGDGSGIGNRTYFLVMELKTDVGSQAPDTFQITFDPGIGSAVEDGTEDTMITVATSSPTVSGEVEVIPEFRLILVLVLTVVFMVGMTRKRRSN